MEIRVPGYCTLCRSSCGSISVVEDGRMVGVEPFPEHPTGGALCSKGRAAPELVHSSRRLGSPLRRMSPKGAGAPAWKEITWDEALGEVAARLGDLREASGAESVAFAVTTPSGTPMVDSYGWVERFIRCFGSPNLIYATEVCAWHKEHMHALTFGRGIGYPDYERADVIVLWGHNPARTWLAQATRIGDARRRGAKVVVIDPKPNGSGQQADFWLRVKPGADAALAMGAINHLITTKSYDKDFVTRWTNGPLLIDPATGKFIRARDVCAEWAPDDFLVLKADGNVLAYDTRQVLEGGDSVELDAEIPVRLLDGRAVRARSAFRLLAEAAAAYTLEKVAEVTWIDATLISAFFALLKHSPRLAYHSWTGVGQHSNATLTERSIAVLYAMTGACDRPGGNIWQTPLPVAPFSDLSLLPSGQKEKALGLDLMPLGPPTRGWVTARDFCRAVLEGEPYKVRALMSFGSNMVVSQPDAQRSLDALHALDFHVHVDMFMNPTAECADIVLPASMPWEREALRLGFEITQSAVETIQLRSQVLLPYRESRHDYDIVCELAKRLNFGDAMFNGDIVAGWDYQLRPLGITVKELRGKPTGMRFPQDFRYEKYSVIGSEGVCGFNTPTRRAELYSERMWSYGYPALPGHVDPSKEPMGADEGSFPLVLTTAKSGFYVHTSYRHISSLRKKSPDPMVEISPALAASRELDSGEWAVVETPMGGVRLRVRINEALDDRVVVAEFGWWDGCMALGRERTAPVGSHSSNINSILSDKNRDPVSGSVPLRAVACEIRPERALNAGRWSGTRDFVVASTRREARDVLAIDLAPGDGGELPDYMPGQHVAVRLPGTKLIRSYSLTGSGKGTRVLSIAVRSQGTQKDVEAGRSLSQLMCRLSIGDRVILEPPGGVFTPPAACAHPLVFLATGVGITPFISYLEAMVLREPLDRPSEVLLLHGCRNSQEHPFAKRLAELEKLLPELKRMTAYSAPLPSDREGKDFNYRGRVNLDVLTPLISKRPLAYLCGSPDFNEGMKEQLISLGMPAFDVTAEAFTSPVPIPAELKSQAVEVIGYRTGFVWSPEDGSLLAAAQAAGIPLPSGCRVGQCGSCTVKIVKGVVAHLGNVESDLNQCVTCQAVPLSDVVLEI